jgi:hypothetical protein
MNLKIPTFVVADNDEPSTKQICTNRILQTVAGVEDLHDFPHGVYNNIAFFKGNLEKYLRTVIGDDYDAMRRLIAEGFGLEETDLEKTPAAVSKLFQTAREAGIHFEFIDSIIEKVDDLK